MVNEIKQRIEQIKRGEVPQGYKKTAVGIVPQEWEDKTLGDLCYNKGSYGINAPSCDFSERLPIYLRITDIDDYGNFIPENKACVDDKDSCNYFLKENDIVFARTGATTGKTYLYSEKDGKLVYAGFLIKFSVNHNKAIAYLVKKQCDTTAYWKWVKTVSARSGQPGINADEYSKYCFYMPNSMTEQQHIADILSKWDEAVSLQEKLIEKLELQKKALVQKLLTPKDGWKKVKVGTLTKELSIRNKDNDCKNIKSVSNKFGFINQDEQFSKQVASQDTSNYKKVNYGNVAYNPSRINVGSIAIYEDNLTCIVSPMYVVFKCINIEPKLLLLLLSTDRGQYDIKTYLTGSVRDSLNYSDLGNIEIRLPDKISQKKIVNIFETIEQSNNLQTQKLTKLKQQQKAMQQLLLTGIVRV